MALTTTVLWLLGFAGLIVFGYLCWLAGYVSGERDKVDRR